MTLVSVYKQQRTARQHKDPFIRKTLKVKAPGILEILTEKQVPTLNISTTSSSTVPLFASIGGQSFVIDATPNWSLISDNGNWNSVIGNLATSVTVTDRNSEMQSQINNLNREIDRLREAVARFETVTGRQVN